MPQTPKRLEQAAVLGNSLLVDVARRAVIATATRLSCCMAVGTTNFALGLLVCVALPGCTVCHNAKRTILDEPAEFSWKTDRKQSVKVYRTWADHAWHQQCAAGCGQRIAGDYKSSAYVAGFKDGFVDFVFAGGAGEPPPVPPRQYWNVGARNPRGHAGAADWFAGFRHGARVALDEGYRERAIVPASMFLLGPADDGSAEPPCFAEPFAPAAQPLPASGGQPELVQPSRLEPPSSSDDNSPAGPASVAPAARSPKAPAKQQSSKSNRPGTHSSDPNSNAQATEKLPLPQAVPLPRVPALAAPATDDAQRQPRPIRRAPERRPAQRDVDEVFDPLAIDLSAYYRPSLRRVNFEQGQPSESIEPAETKATLEPAEIGQTAEPVATSHRVEKSNRTAYRRPAAESIATATVATARNHWRAATPPAKQPGTDRFEGRQAPTVPQFAR